MLYSVNVNILIDIFIFLLFFLSLLSNAAFKSLLANGSFIINNVRSLTFIIFF